MKKFLIFILSLYSFASYGQTSIFTSQIPASAAAVDAPVCLGVKFRSTANGYIIGVRYYWQTGMTGTHVGDLWSSSGTKLGEVNYTTTGTGWQSAYFATPIAITSGTTYIASTYFPDGDYSADGGWFTSSGTTNGVLTGLQQGVDGDNGVYAYNASVPAFPNTSFNHSNYWVDVIYSPTIAPPPSGPTTALSFSIIPFANTDILSPGRGVEMWNGIQWDNSNAPEVPNGTTQGLNYYTRFNWSDIEGSTQGSYNFTEFDRRFKIAIDNGQMFEFGVMPICIGCGASGAYPVYLHTEMQTETVKDWVFQGSNIPNWNSAFWISRWKALMMAIATHINATTYSGKRFQDVLYSVDIRGYGNDGEWNIYPWAGNPSAGCSGTSCIPAGANATAATLDTLITANTEAFPNIPNLITDGAFDGGNASLIPPQTSYFALTYTYPWGQLGWRRDNWGQHDEDNILANNGGSYNPGSGSVQFNTLILNKYKFAPIGGEPSHDNTQVQYTCGSYYCDQPREISLYHAASFGNGNYPISASDAGLQANITAASKLCGYRLNIAGGSMTTTPNSTGSINITLNWQNVGIAPNYENWNVTYELRTATGAVVWSAISGFTPKLFLPSVTATAQSDTYTLPSIAPGLYNLFLIIRDPVGYKAPLQIAINGRNADGAYLIRGNVQIVSISPQPCNCFTKPRGLAASFQ